MVLKALDASSMYSLLFLNLNEFCIHEGHGSLQNALPVIELELTYSGASIMIIHAEATLLGKCKMRRVLQTSDSWRLGVKIFRVWLFLAIISERSRDWKCGQV